MSKQEEAGLILKLYELRREEELRKARDWFFRDCNPQSLDDWNAIMFSAHSGHARMVITYWDMAAALVNHGAISLDLFTETNGEYYMVFAKIEPILGEIRAALSPMFAANLEKLINSTPDGQKRLTMTKEMIKNIRARLSATAAAS